MFRIPAATVRKLAVVALAAAAVIPATAQAQTFSIPAQQCIKDTTGPDYNVRLCGVTDVDQFRSELPGNGSSYCMPTSFFNVLHYFAEDLGVPMSFGIGAINPANRADYANTTTALGWISTVAGGNPSTGSASYGGIRGAFDTFTAYAKAKGWDFASGFTSADPDTDFGYELAKRLRQGPLQLGYKRWNKGLPSDGTVWNYDGSGHAVTVVAARGKVGADEVKLLLADPGRAPDHGIAPDYLDTQSAYTLEEVTIKRVEILSNGAPDSDGGGIDDLAPGHKKQFVWELTGPNYKTWQLGGTQRAIVHGYNWFSASKPG